MKDELLLRYLNKHCSTDEIQQVYEWLAESEEHRTHFFELEQLWALKAEMHFSNPQRMELAYHQLSTQLGWRKTISKSGFEVHHTKLDEICSPTGYRILADPKLRICQ